MDSFEVNKILGAILGTCLGVLSINIAAGAIFTPVKPAKPGYEIAVPEQAPAGKPAEPEKQEPIEQLLAKADLDLRGQIGWPAVLVLEVLVARLAQNSRVASSTANRRRSTRATR